MLRENPPALSSRSGQALTRTWRLQHVRSASHFQTRYSLRLRRLWFEAPNSEMKLADKVAAVGYYVWFLIFFVVITTTDKPLSIWTHLMEQEKGFEDAKQVVAALRIEVYLQLELQGFAGVVSLNLMVLGLSNPCVLAIVCDPDLPLSNRKVVTELAKSDNIQAAVLLHPSLVKVDDMKGVDILESSPTTFSYCC
ncbi:hypothetical protein P3S67_020952 [Capsicum chacoense]